MTKPAQPHYFPAGDDLPLFTGEAPRVTERPFKPQPVYRQPNVFDLWYRTTRPELFHARCDASRNLSGDEVELRAGVEARLLHASTITPGKLLVATDDGLFAWVWNDFVVAI